ncbi:Carbonic anhydrase 1 [Frankliniella fusca]|uniref:Carbonic anhydrase n=1 Tax=Frankliniella fusca TaxID=407009 RepID=A0AAE1LH22_9NEOP|nr:Carbonic anhydrase 1 [Frankliniella fusca]
MSRVAGNGWTGVCRNGTDQSPIDILHGDKGFTTPASYEPLVFVNYDNLVNYNLTNNGHTAMLTPHNTCSVYISGGGLRKLYKLEQMHFHWGSEHLVNGQRYALEVHLVHYDAKYPSLQEAMGNNNSLAVVAVLFRENKSQEPNAELAQVVAGLRAVTEPGHTAQLAARFSPAMLLPGDTERWWRYAGSLTTPGCDQGVVWTVFRDTLPVARDQVKEFQRLLTHPADGSSSAEYMLKNYRQPQSTKGRAVHYQDPGQPDKCGAAATAGSPALAVAVLVLALAAARS